MSTQPQNLNDRAGVRLSTVFKGAITQFGRTYDCKITDVSEFGAKAHVDHVFVKDQPVNLVFERLGPYRAMASTVAWQGSGSVGLHFTCSEATRHAALATLMPMRWQQVHEKSNGKTP